MKLLRLPARLPAFTYVELMMVLGILGVLLSISILSVGPLMSKTDMTAFSQVLVADAVSMQLKSMRREPGASGQTTPFGVYFEPEQYVLFQGDSYNAADPENIVVPLGDEVRFSTINLPANTVLFERGSGDVVNYDPLTSSVVLSQNSTGASIVVQFNRHGIIQLIE